ncbi:MAG: cyclic nucleotide-binding/CBS domain-containing protein [Magnetococcales bacterium]|nr:cyclic nucleotide-binding/CBS domain-containing protein [Magnetococcales bacterium]
MNVDTEEIIHFLASHPPFALLSREQLAAIAARLDIVQTRRGHEILAPGGKTNVLHLIRSGAVDVHGPGGKLLLRLGEGEIFGAEALLRGGKVRNRVTAIEKTLLYLLPQQEFHRLCQEEDAFAEFIVPLGAERLRSALQRQDPPDLTLALNLGASLVRDLPIQPMVLALPNLTIREAAQWMQDRTVPALLISDGERLLGLVTDRDLTTRVVATAMDPSQPVAQVMTPDPVTIGIDDQASDAMLLMVEKNIKHLPVLDGERPAGLLTSQDLTVRQLGSTPVYLISTIARMERLEDLRAVAREVPNLLVTMTAANATALSMGKAMAFMTDAFTKRLIRMAEERLGAPPVPYVWLAGGSQGRQEQMVGGDQDNCLILDNGYDPQYHGLYFEALTRFVCDSLDLCGYDHCPGNMMASNPTWRTTLSEWQQNFTQWISQPDPKALMLVSVFFDLRPIHGEMTLADELRTYILDKARGATVFHAHMSVNALSRTPPLGFFRDFVLRQGGKYADTLDLKLTGVIPVVDLARVYALESGVEAVNTHERLAAAGQQGIITESSARDLRDALEFIAFTRCRHQARAIKASRIPNNHLPPTELSEFERRHLKDAFRVVQVMQRSLASRHHIDRM